MTTSTARAQRDDHSLDVVPLRRPWQWVSAVVVVGGLSFLAYTFVSNPRTRWDVIGEYLFSDRVLRGVWYTLVYTVLAMVIGVVVGVVAALMRMSNNVVLQGVAGFYVWLFRGTPVLVQLVFWANIGALYPTISLGIPFGPTLVESPAREVVGLFVAVLLGLGLNEGAYMSEIVRAGIISVNRGQTEAAQAIGMRGGAIMRRIVLPQALRVIIPPTGNELISMLKTTSIVSVIAAFELFTVVRQIMAANYQQVPMLIVAAIWYLAMSSVLSIGQYFLERRIGRGQILPPPTLLHRVARSAFIRTPTAVHPGHGGEGR